MEIPFDGDGQRILIELGTSMGDVISPEEAARDWRMMSQKLKEGALKAMRALHQSSSEVLDQWKGDSRGA